MKWYHCQWRAYSRRGNLSSQLPYITRVSLVAVSFSPSSKPRIIFPLGCTNVHFFYLTITPFVLAFFFFFFYAVHTRSSGLPYTRIHLLGCVTARTTAWTETRPVRHARAWLSLRANRAVMDYVRSRVFFFFFFNILLRATVPSLLKIWRMRRWWKMSNIMAMATNLWSTIRAASSTFLPRNKCVLG